MCEQQEIPLFDRQTAVQKGIIHAENHQRNHRRLGGFYGRVASRQNETILRHCQGQSVLDVGAGYGNFTRQLLNAGKKAVGIEIDEEKISRAREWFGVELQFADFYDWKCKEGSVDTIVFREVLNHLNLDTTLIKAFRITRYRCLVFQGTEILPLRMAKRMYCHTEYNQKRIEDIILGLKQVGFIVRRVIFCDVIAFPLSGGFAGRCLVPSLRLAALFVLGIDSVADRLINMLRLGRFLCFRVLIVAEKPGLGDS